MRLAAFAIVAAAALGACDDDTVAPAPDLSVALDLAATPDDAAAPDLMPPYPCGEPFMRCCDGQTPACNPATAVCNEFGVCVSCGLYPLACCPGSGCQSNQTCLGDATSGGTFCYPCGHAGQPCCFEGPACVQPGTQCIEPDGGNPTCST